MTTTPGRSELIISTKQELTRHLETRCLVRFSIIMWTLKFKGRQTKAFFCCRQSNVRLVFLGYHYCREPFRCLKLWSTINLITPLGSSRKLGEAAENLIDGSEKRICRLSFEFQSPLVIVRRSKPRCDRRTLLFIFCDHNVHDELCSSISFEYRVRKLQSHGQYFFIP